MSEAPRLGLTAVVLGLGLVPIIAADHAVVGDWLYFAACVVIEFWLIAVVARLAFRERYDRRISAGRQ
jgi:hypothetical protein